MGKNLKQQRRGKGTPKYLAPSHRYIGEIKYPFGVSGQGKVKDLVHSVGKKTPVAIVDFGGKNELMIPADGTYVGQDIYVRGNTTTGSIAELRSISDGSKIFNIELRPGDGGTLCRAPGSCAMLIAKTEKTCLLELPSKRQISLPLNCLATVGSPAGSGREEKPYMMAGNKFHAMRATNRWWPRVRAVAMNPVDHPFGGKTKPGTPIAVSRHKPPGAKVGSLSPRRTGKRKR